VAETVTASDTPDGTVVPITTWEAATVASVTLSGGNLVPHNPGTTSPNQGAHTPTTAGKTSGKYYFEHTLTTLVPTGGANLGVGVGTTSSTYTNMGNSATTGAAGFIGSRNIWSNGANSGSVMGPGAIGSGSVICIAVDLDNRKIWFRPGPPFSNWNNSGTDNPATNTGGVTIPAGTMIPFVTFGGTSGTSGNKFTTNFGASAFSRTVPSGFTSGCPL